MKQSSAPILLLAFALLIGSPLCSFADSEDQTSFWFMSLTRLNISERTEAFIDLQPRTELDAADDRGEGQVQQFLARGAYGYRLDDTHTLFQGYAAITNYDPVRTEHRSFQELLSRFSFDSFKYAHRFRFEQRFLDGIDDVSLRARSFSRFVYPLDMVEGLSLALNEELFINVNDADGGPQTGFDQNRLFLGVNYRVHENLSFDVGYQNQYVGRRGGRDDISNHIAFFGAISSFDLY